MGVTDVRCCVLYFVSELWQILQKKEATRVIDYRYVWS
jgi:hypothetical protein